MSEKIHGPGPEIAENKPHQEALVVLDAIFEKMSRCKSMQLYAPSGIVELPEETGEEGSVPYRLALLRKRLLDRALHLRVTSCSPDNIWIEATFPFPFAIEEEYKSSKETGTVLLIKFDISKKNRNDHFLTDESRREDEDPLSEAYISISCKNGQKLYRRPVSEYAAQEAVEVEAVNLLKECSLLEMTPPLSNEEWQYCRSASKYLDCFYTLYLQAEEEVDALSRAALAFRHISEKFPADTTTGDVLRASGASLPDHVRRLLAAYRSVSVAECIVTLEQKVTDMSVVLGQKHRFIEAFAFRFSHGTTPEEVRHQIGLRRLANHGYIHPLYGEVVAVIERDWTKATMIHIPLGEGDSFTSGSQYDDTPANDPHYRSFIAEGRTNDDDRRLAEDIKASLLEQFPYLEVQNNIYVTGSYHERYQGFDIILTGLSLSMQAAALKISLEQLLEACYAITRTIIANEVMHSAQR